LRITEYEDASTSPPTGSSIAALDSTCSTHSSNSLRAYHDTATCAPGATNPSIEMTVGNSTDYIYAVGAEGLVSASLGGGNDSYYGGAGIDRILGDAGNDTLTGEDNRDSIHGGSGNDVIFGDGDTDTLYGDDGNDTFYGGDGDDVIHGGAGVNGYDCGPGNDVIYVNTYDEWGSRSTGCESYVIEP
jgi:Ca2+-binding RTX toxin-like protein